MFLNKVTMSHIIWPVILEQHCCQTEISNLSKVNLEFSFNRFREV